jgi:serine/threonine protein phosphatase 1
MVHSRLIAIGDIHGCFVNLRKLIEKVSPEKNDLFIFLGDYIDRGPDSPHVVEYLIEFEKQYKSVFLLGNHEQMCLDYFEDGDPVFLMNRGDETLQQYDDSGISISDHFEFFRTLRTYYETRDFIFVHAGLRPEISLHSQEKIDLLWIRDDYQNSDYDWGKTIVSGHTWWHSPVFHNNRIILDTGACHGNYLTACDVLTRRIWTA